VRCHFTPGPEAGAPQRSRRRPPGAAMLHTFGHEERNHLPMARLSGVDLPREKRVEVALTYIFGVGRTRAGETLAATGVNPDTRVRDLTEADIVKLREWIDANYRVEGDLKREIQQDIRRKIEIGCYQGIRHRRGLPVHGQRTHTNARTRKGPRRAIAGKKKAGKK
jgi:small subunit ribosomal protein S13